MSPGHLKEEGSGPGWPLASENYVTLCGGHVWLLRGVCMVAPGGCMVALGACMVALGGAWLLPGGHAWLLSWGGAWDMTRYGDTINERAVRILLECILVNHADACRGKLENSLHQ